MNVGSSPFRLPVSIVIPARDEETVLPETLASAVASGASEILVVDDNSRDATPRILAYWQQRDARVQAVAAGALPSGWTGKNHAVWVGARATTQPWILFLDADTRLLPGGLDAALRWATGRQLDALSLSPEQETGSIWERAAQPVVFHRLGRTFSFDEINDPARDAAAANGQFILIRRDAYFGIGGHAALRGEVLEDVGLARRLKQQGYAFEFRSGQGWVRTRMYRDLQGLWLGWSKNLYLLFGSPWRYGRVLPSFLPLLGVVACLYLAALEWWTAAAALAGILGLAHLRYALHLRRIGWRGARYYAPGSALVGMMWWHSARLYHRSQTVTWKGREIPVAVPAAKAAAACGSGGPERSNMEESKEDWLSVAGQPASRGGRDQQER